MAPSNASGPGQRATKTSSRPLATHHDNEHKNSTLPQITVHKVPVLSVSHSDVISERPAAGQPTAAAGQTKNDLHDVRRKNTVAKSTASSLISTTGKTNIVTAGLVIFD